MDNSYNIIYMHSLFSFIINSRHCEFVLNIAQCLFSSGSLCISNKLEIDLKTRNTIRESLARSSNRHLGWTVGTSGAAFTRLPPNPYGSDVCGGQERQPDCFARGIRGFIAHIAILSLTPAREPDMPYDSMGLSTESLDVWGVTEMLY